MAAHYNEFSSFIELLTVYNFSYLGSESIQEFVSLNVLGIRKWKETLVNKHLIAAETLKVSAESNGGIGDEVKVSTSVVIKNQIEQDIKGLPERIELLTEKVRWFYLVGGINAIIFLLMDGLFDGYLCKSFFVRLSFLNSILVFNVFLNLGLLLLIQSKKNHRFNINLLIIILFVIAITVFNFLPEYKTCDLIHSSSSLIVYSLIAIAAPFFLHFISIQIFSYRSKGKLKRINKFLKTGEI